jgi:hypothetical protein
MFLRTLLNSIYHVIAGHTNKLTHNETAAAGIAATAAGLTYLDGKYHIRQDWQMTRAKNKGAKMFQKARKFSMNPSKGL